MNDSRAILLPHRNVLNISEVVITNNYHKHICLKVLNTVVLHYF